MEPANVVVMFVAVPAKSKRSNRGIQTITLPLGARPAPLGARPAHFFSASRL